MCVYTFDPFHARLCPCVCLSVWRSQCEIKGRLFGADRYPSNSVTLYYPRCRKLPLGVVLFSLVACACRRCQWWSRGPIGHCCHVHPLVILITLTRWSFYHSAPTGRSYYSTLSGHSITAHPLVIIFEDRGQFLHSATIGMVSSFGITHQWVIFHMAHPVVRRRYAPMV
ncbi:hypothetical protein Btru_039319 [Bulinus truncatus]|nr:hypothetical protein Btru_039319 [Bulinus truncatus]